MDVLAALNDRLFYIDSERPAQEDLADPAGWVHAQITASTPTANLAGALPRPLLTQAARSSAAANQLATRLPGFRRTW